MFLRNKLFLLLIAAVLFLAFLYSLYLSLNNFLWIETRTSQLTEKLKKFYMLQSIQRRKLLHQYLERNTSHLKMGPYYNGLVPEIICPWLARIGHVDDGGKWTCNPWALSSNCIVYSLGIGDNISFETELDEVTEGRCKIYSFDPDYNNGKYILNLNNPRFIFQAYNISKQTDYLQQQFSLKDIIKQHHHSFIDFLKIDIEGSLFSTYSVKSYKENNIFPFHLLYLSISMLTALTRK